MPDRRAADVNPARPPGRAAPAGARRRRAAVALLLAGWLASAGVGAQPADDVDATLAGARLQLDAVRQRTGQSPSLDALSALRAEATAIERRSAALEARLVPELANLDARLAGLGAPPANADREAASIAAERGALARQRSRIDAELRLARLLVIDSDQLTEQLTDLRRARFGAQMGERSASLLDGRFWADLREAWPPTRERMVRLTSDAAAAARAEGAVRWMLALAAVLAFVAAAWRGSPLLPRAVAAAVPSARLRRSLLALALAVVPPLLALLAGAAVAAALGAGTATPEVAAIWRSLVVAVAFGVYVAALGRALLSVQRPSWRLLPIPDVAAYRLRADPLLLGAVVGASTLLDRWIALTHAELATQVAVNGIVSLLMGGLLVWSLRRSELARRLALAQAHAPGTPLRSLWLLSIEALSWAALVVSLACLLLGYVALGTVLVKQVAWLTIVGSSAYVLIAFFEDASFSWLGAARSVDVEGAGGGGAGTGPADRQRAAVLVAGVSRLAVFMVAAVAMVGPLGQNPMEMLDRAGSAFREGVALGQTRVLPSALLQSVLTVALGFWAVSALRRWLLNKYLPTTEFDSSMRLSVATLLVWAGWIATVALALSALGLGLERLAWIASALSVGIGFGLRVFVQNFLSGLVLLTERPLSVGDTVAVDGTQGQIRRINLRTTEVELDDQSLALIPNFVFATKVVRNITQGGRRGWVELRLQMPLTTDAALILEVMAAALRENVEILAEPPPRALLDGVENGNLVFVATGTVATPRQAASAKSALLRELLMRLAARGVDLQRVSAMLVREQPPAGGTRNGLDAVAAPAAARTARAESS